MERVNVKGIILEIIVTAVITLITQGFLMLFNLDSGKIEILQVHNSSGEYNVLIAIKNLKENEYLKGIEVEIEKNIKINNLDYRIGNIECSENLFKINQVSPNDIEYISFCVEEELTSKNIKIIKNKNRIRIENLNDESAIDGSVIIVILMYTLIFGIISFISTYYSDKKAISRFKIVEDSKKVLNEKIEIVEERLKNVLNQTEKNEEILLYAYAEIKDLTKENDYYRMLFKDILGENTKLNYKVLEKKITNTLKTYTTDDEFVENYEKLKFLSAKIRDMQENKIK
ncbi:MAG: hypothetical protein IJO08_03050 [Clostridia bacterium]|nr:hypothetical protein [Clostridia bacterium]